MVKVRKSKERGQADHGWLKSMHTFSFASYYDAQHMGFRSLRVINQDRVAPGGGFPTHPHKDMEIFSYVLEGALRHEDSMGNGRDLRPGEIQLMSAGTGVRHSEFNPSSTEPLHFLQIWILPERTGMAPSYTEWRPTQEQAAQGKVLVISPDGREDSAVIHQDVFVYRIRIKSGDSISHDLAEHRGAWLQMISGSIQLNGTHLHSGDAASMEVSGALEISASEDTEALLFDLK